MRYFIIGSLLLLGQFGFGETNGNHELDRNAANSTSPGAPRAFVPPPSPAIQALIQQLDSLDFSERNSAHRQLNDQLLHNPQATQAALAAALRENSGTGAPLTLEAVTRARRLLNSAQVDWQAALLAARVGALAHSATQPSTDLARQLNASLNENKNRVDQLLNDLAIATSTKRKERDGGMVSPAEQAQREPEIRRLRMALSEVYTNIITGLGLEVVRGQGNVDDEGAFRVVVRKPDGNLFSIVLHFGAMVSSVVPDGRGGYVPKTLSLPMDSILSRVQQATLDPVGDQQARPPFRTEVPSALVTDDKDGTMVSTFELNRNFTADLTNYLSDQYPASSNEIRTAYRQINERNKKEIPRTAVGPAVN